VRATGYDGELRVGQRGRALQNELQGTTSSTSLGE
jgi:hypothetical protein